MQRRERMLAAAVAVLLTVYFANWLYQAVYRDPLDARLGRVERLKTEIQKQELQVRRARRHGASADL